MTLFKEISKEVIEENKELMEKLSEGVKHDTGKPPIGLISREALIQVAKVMEFGATKYERDNWRKGMKWQRLLDASLRHILAFNEGEDKDPETGLSHLAHAACCLHFLLDYEKNHANMDDRYKQSKEGNKE